MLAAGWSVHAWTCAYEMCNRIASAAKLLLPLLMCRVGNIKDGSLMATDPVCKQAW